MNHDVFFKKVRSCTTALGILVLLLMGAWETTHILFPDPVSPVKEESEVGYLQKRTLRQNRGLTGLALGASFVVIGVWGLSPLLSSVLIAGGVVEMWASYLALDTTVAWQLRIGIVLATLVLLIWFLRRWEKAS